MKVLEAQHHLFVARGKAWNARGTGALLYSLVQVGRAISRPKLSCPIHESMSQSPRGWCFHSSIVTFKVAIRGQC